MSRFAANNLTVLMLASALPLSQLSAGPGADNPFGGKRVLIVGIDGVRSDALKKQVDEGKAPVMAKIIADGTVTWNAYVGGDLGTPTQQATSSGPGWTSILTGTWIDLHHVNGNGSPPCDKPELAGSYLVGQAPHFARRLKEVAPAAYVSSISSWNWIEDYLVAAQPEVIDHHEKGIADSYPPRDADVKNKAVAHLATADPDVLFLHFDQVDGAGHHTGFSPSSAAYLEAITTVDGLVGEILTAIGRRPRFAEEKWMVIVLADHGGTPGGAHGGQSEGERIIPLIVSGGGVHKGVSTASPGMVAVPATVMRYLGVGIPASWRFAGDAFATGPDLTATRKPDGVRLDWILPAAGIPGLTGFEIFRDGTKLGSLPPGRNSFTDPAARPGPVVYELGFSGTPEARLRAPIYLSGPGEVAWDDSHGNSFWNTADANWSGGLVYSDGLRALFTGTGETVHIRPEGVSPSATRIIGNGSYTFNGGPIGGTLEKRGTGTLTLESPNRFAAVSLDEGSVMLGHGGALGGGTLAIRKSASVAASGQVVLPNPVALSADGGVTTTLIAKNGTTFQLDGMISGGNPASTFFVNTDTAGGSTGLIKLTHPRNSFQGTIRINRGGLALTTDSALGHPSNPLFLDIGTPRQIGLRFDAPLTCPRPIRLGRGRQVIDTNGSPVALTGPVTGDGQLVKSGPGTLTLAATTAHTGETIVENGTLAVNGKLASCPAALTVARNGTLGGTGTVMRPVVVDGTLAPGANASGTLSLTGDLTLRAGAIWTVRIPGPNAGPPATVAAEAIRIAATPDAKLTVRLDLSALKNLPTRERSFTLATAASPPTGLTPDNWHIETTSANNNAKWSIRTDGKEIKLVCGGK
ncbi:MAG: alkaline phosphatase family protein [Verrucomicrobia bacterium]|nr:alkaline phosphatase family protein [Verrucomicrobiota bacterium]